MNHKIRILSDVKGYVTAIVDIDGTEYIVELHTVGMTTSRRNELIRRMAMEMARLANG